jgi:hypothetical protein
MGDNDEGKLNIILPFDHFKDFSYTEETPIVSKIDVPYDVVIRKIIETMPYNYTVTHGVLPKTLMTPSINGNLAKLKLFQHNHRELINEIYKKKGDPYCLVKYKTTNLVVDKKIKEQFDSYLIKTKEILELVYGIYEEKKIKRTYFGIKDQEPTYEIDYERRHSEHAESRSKDKLDMIKYVRNFQVIMMCEIYSFIKERYNAIKNLEDPINLIDLKVLEKLNESEVKKELTANQLLTKEQIKLKGEKFLNELNNLTHKQLLKVIKVIKTKYISDISMNLLLIVDKRLYNFDKFISEKYKIDKEPKIKYIYIMFVKYLKEIYLPYICNAFTNLSDYEKFNLFNVHYLMNLLILKNNIFFYKKLDITYFDLDGRVKDDIKNTIAKIEKINSILNNIYLFFNSLYENNEIEKKRLGCILLGTESDKFDKELKKSLFFSNLLIDEALQYICPLDYDSEIINSPGSPGSKEIEKFKENNFCKVIDEIPYTDATKRTKMYGPANSLDKYRSTCQEKYETMDYLAINSPLSKFMLFYWSSLMNSYLTERAIKKRYNNVLIWDENNILYDEDTKMVKENRNRTSIEEIMTTKLYLGYIKLTLNDSIKVIFIFLSSYFIELFDIYGTPIPYGNYDPFSFSTSQEIERHLFNKSIFNLVDTDKKKKSNKSIYLMLQNNIEQIPHNTETFFKLLNNTDQKPYWKVPSTPAEWHKEIEQAPEKEDLAYWDNPEWREQFKQKMLEQARQPEGQSNLLYSTKKQPSQILS